MCTFQFISPRLFAEYKKERSTPAIVDTAVLFGEGHRICLIPKKNDANKKALLFIYKWLENLLFIWNFGILLL
jgi:hypothetical protein